MIFSIQTFEIKLEICVKRLRDAQQVLYILN